MNGTSKIHSYFYKLPTNNLVHRRSKSYWNKMHDKYSQGKSPKGELKMQVINK